MNAKRDTSPSATDAFFRIALVSIIIPWCTWVTVSIYSQREEISVSKAILQILQKRFAEH